VSPEGFVTLIGGFPEKSPLKTKVLAVEEFENYTRKLIEYTTEGEERIQAWLLLPRNGTQKAPGILAIHQDGAKRPYEHGKSEPAGIAGDPELGYALELCLRGYIVICPNRFPFESRRLENSRHRETFKNFRIFAHFQDQKLEVTEDLYGGCVAAQLLYEGRTKIGKTVYEMVRAVDCLSEQPEVDADHIGVIGHSAGGFYAALTAYVDPRVKAVCSSTGTFLIRWILGGESYKPINGFAGLAIPGMKQWGDVDDILAGLAPRPFLETAGDQGIPDSMWDEKYGKARTRYEEIGHPDRFVTVIYAGGHVFPGDMREKSYSWFDRWLKQR